MPLSELPMLDASSIAFIVLAALWTLPWKGFALWRAARNGDRWWFVALLIVNTLALLEILYIFVFSKRAKTELAPPGAGPRPEGSSSHAGDRAE